MSPGLPSLVLILGLFGLAMALLLVFIQKSLRQGALLATSAAAWRGLPIVTFIFFLSGAVFTWRYLEGNLKLHRQAQFESDMHRLVLMFKESLEDSVNALYGGQGLFVASQEVSRLEWRAYVAGQNFFERYPGVTLFAFARRVSSGDLDFMTDAPMNSQAERPERFVLEYVEPGTAQDSIGYDLSSDPAFAEALMKARDTGREQMAVSFFPRKGVPQGESWIMICLPIYQNGLPIETSLQRVSAHRGFVCLMLDLQEEMEILLELHATSLMDQIEIEDAAAPEKKRILFSWKASPQDQNPAYTFKVTRSIDVLGTSWKLTCSSLNRSQGFIEEKIPWLILFGGVFASVLLLRVLLAMRDARKTAVYIAESMMKEARKTDEEKIRLANAIDQANDGVVITDPNQADNPIIYVNKTFERTTGYSAEEVLGRNPRFLQGPLTHPGTIAEIRAAVRNRQKIKTAVLNYRKDGIAYWNGLRISPIFSSDGSLQYFLGFNTDISDRIQMEELLMENNDRFHKVIRATGTVVWDWNLRTQAFVWSPNFEEVFHYPPGETGMTVAAWHQRIHAEDLKLVQEGIASAIREGEQFWTGEYRFCRQDGSYADVQDSVFIVRDAQKEAIRVIGAMQDISERKRLHFQLVQAQKMETVGTLAGGIAHDLNNQLTPVKGYIDLIMQQVQKEDEKYELLWEAEQAVGRCQEVVQRLLGFSRPSNQKKTTVHLAGILWELRNLLPKALPANISTQVYFDQNLWPMQGNETEIQSVLMNLATNARDAMPEGGEFYIKAENVTFTEKSVKSGYAAGPYIKLIITDNGKGMPPEVVSRIYEPFFTTKRKGQGTGLGLSMVFSIIKDHKGWIEVSSQVGKGTTFVIYFLADPGAIPELKKTGEVPASRGNETILLADDEETLRTMGRLFLEKLGYKVLLAGDGAEALDIYRAHHHEIQGLVLDMTMPKMTGRQLIKAVLEVNSKAKILVVSGYTSEGGAREILGDGAKDFLPKPFTIGPLSQAIRKVLDS